MSRTDSILIVDSTVTRREDLCKLWSDTIGYQVVYYGGGDFFGFPPEGGKPAIILGKDIDSVNLTGCLFHLNDLDQYKDATLNKVVDSCARIVLFSGVGLVERKADWPQSWFWIPRAISGRGSARERVWREFGDWLATKPSSSDDGVNIELLSVPKRPHFLIALYILCQGFLAGERMRARVPAISQTRKREWWSVPLLQSAGDNLVDVVRQEWGASVSVSVLRLVEWIADKAGKDEPDLAEIVAEAKKELESRLAK